MNEKDKEWVQEKIDYLEKFLCSLIADKITHLAPSQDTKENLKNIYTKLEAIESNKVSWKHFTWILATVLGLYVVISAAIWAEMQNMRQNLFNNAKALVSIEATLRQAEIAK